MKSLCEIRNKKCCNLTDEINSVVDFYESIPDYSELYHLPEEDFYTKIQILRGTCCDLKEKCLLSKRNDHKKSKKKMKKQKQQKDCQQDRRRHSESSAFESSNHRSISSSTQSFRMLSKCNSFICDHNDQQCLIKVNHDNDNHDDYFDLDNFQRIRSSSFTTMPILPLPPPPPSFPLLCTSSKTSKKKFKSTLRKCKKTTTNLQHQNKFSTDMNVIKKDLPSSSRLQEFKCDDSRKSISKTTENAMNLNDDFTTINNNDTMICSSRQTNNMNMVPPPRLNLAANLRISYLRKKYNDLELDDHIYNVIDDNQDDGVDCSSENITKRSKSQISTTKQSEWNVKNNSAWKMLKTNKKGVDDILARLAQRKIEEKCLKREHELNMELMRQRVKSSPLLLEGLHNWKHNSYEFPSIKKHQCSMTKQRSNSNLRSNK